MEKTRKKRRPARLAGIIILIFVLFLILSVFGINAAVVYSGGRRIVSPEDAAGLGADCVLVLGAGVVNGSPSPMLADRLDLGIELYFSGAGEKLLLSGDHGQVNYDEVSVMRDYALAAGVPAEDIFLDHAGFSTYESMYRAGAVFQAERVVVVTQRYHLYRALYTGQRLGLTVWGAASDPREYAGQTYRDCREILARVKDWGCCVFKPLPTFLGEAVPIQGPGNAYS